MRLLIASMAALAAVAFAAPSFAQDETTPAPGPVDHRQAQGCLYGVLQQDQEQLAAQRLPEEGPGRQGAAMRKKTKKTSATPAAPKSPEMGQLQPPPPAPAVGQRRRRARSAFRRCRPRRSSFELM